MKVLVANIGSTSFKFRLFDFADGAERELAAGGVDRIGGAGGTLTCSVGDAGERLRAPCECVDHGRAIAVCLDALVERGVLSGAGDLDAVAFKAVMARDIDPVVRVDEKVLAAMEYFAPAAPAHNPAYVAAMRSFAGALPGTPLVAAFEPGFHRTIPERRWRYACPRRWTDEFGVRRYGYHGASHRYVAERTAELCGASRIISCHLGGSSSVCAIRDGASVATSLGFSPQSGLPQGSRVGEFDPFALALIARETGLSLEQMLAELGSSGGLAAISGTSGDARDIESAAAGGDEKAATALASFATAVRDYVGAYVVELGGLDALVFTGGIGEHSPVTRRAVCRGMDFLGIVLDEGKNAAAKGECRIDADGSPTAIWAMPTNEELIVARQAREFLAEPTQDSGRSG